MFSLRNYIKRGLLDAVGKQPDYWVIINSVGWMEKNVLLEEDLAEINDAIVKNNLRAEADNVVAEDGEPDV